MAASLKASFILKLEDQLSGGLAKLNKSLSVLGDVAKKVTLDPLSASASKLPGVTQAVSALGRAVDAVGSAAGRAEAAMGRLWNRTRSAAGAGWAGMRGLGEKVGPIGAALAGVSLFKPIAAYGDYENILRHIAITEKKSGPAVDPEVARLTGIFAHDALATGQSSESIAKAYSDLVQRGIPSNVLDTAIIAHSRAATAYNMNPEDMGGLVGGLLQSMDIPEGNLGEVLAAFAAASKEGRFKMEDFSRNMPGVFGVMSKLGMTGRGNADMAAASMEMISRNVAIPSQASTQFYDLMEYLTTPFGKHSFAKGGIDLTGLKLDAEKKGIPVLEAVISAVQRHTKGMSTQQRADYLGTIVHNSEARSGLAAILQYMPELLKLRTALAGVNKATLDTDFASAFAAPISQVRIFNETLEQLERRLGKGFSPVLGKINTGLEAFLGGIERLDQRMPGLADTMLIGTGALLAITAVMGVIGVVGPAVAAGFSLLAAGIAAIGGMPVILGGMLVGELAYGIWKDWDKVKASVGGAVGAWWTDITDAFGQQSRAAADRVHADMAWLGSLLPDWMRDALGLPKPQQSLGDRMDRDPDSGRFANTAATPWWGRVDVHILWDENTGRFGPPEVKTDSPNINVLLGPDNGRPASPGRSLDREYRQD